MTNEDKPYARMSQSWGPELPEDGSVPGDTNTAILTGSRRNAPGADTFWAQNHAVVTDPPEIE